MQSKLVDVNGNGPWAAAVSALQKYYRWVGLRPGGPAHIYDRMRSGETGRAFREDGAWAPFDASSSPGVSPLSRAEMRELAKGKWTPRGAETGWVTFENPAQRQHLKVLVDATTVHAWQSAWRTGMDLDGAQGFTDAALETAKKLSANSTLANLAGVRVAGKVPASMLDWNAPIQLAGRAVPLEAEAVVMLQYPQAPLGSRLITGAVWDASTGDDHVSAMIDDVVRLQLGLWRHGVVMSGQNLDFAVGVPRAGQRQRHTGQALLRDAASARPVDIPGLLEHLETWKGGALRQSKWAWFMGTQIPVIGPKVGARLVDRLCDRLEDVAARISVAVETGVQVGATNPLTHVTPGAVNLPLLGRDGAALGQ